VDDQAKMWIMNRSDAAWSKWAGLIEAQGASGISASRFCAERGVPTSSFFAWKRKIRERASGSHAARASSGFIEAKVVGRGSAREDGGGARIDSGCVDTGGVAIELRGGRRVAVARGFDRELLREVLAALEAEGASS
jgi:hypothetical protein